MGAMRGRFTKAERKQLRALVHDAHAAEARRMLEVLDAEFARWRQGEVDSFELIERIHRFHDGDNRGLWKLYNAGLSEEWMVARGLHLGLLQSGEVPPGMVERLPPWILAQDEDDAGSGAEEAGEEP